MYILKCKHKQNVPWLNKKILLKQKFVTGTHRLWTSSKYLVSVHNCARELGTTVVLQGTHTAVVLHFVLMKQTCHGSTWRCLQSSTNFSHLSPVGMSWVFSHLLEWHTLLETISRNGKLPHRKRKPKIILLCLLLFHHIILTYLLKKLNRHLICVKGKYWVSLIFFHLPANTLTIPL